MREMRKSAPKWRHMVNVQISLRQNTNHETPRYVSHVRYTHIGQCCPFVYVPIDEPTMNTKRDDSKSESNNQRNQKISFIQTQQDQEGSTSDDVNNYQNSDLLLQNILQKLRPFQREAVDFATKGTMYNRQWDDDTVDTCYTTQQKYESLNSFSYDQTLLGKGRILLADEMVRLHKALSLSLSLSLSCGNVQYLF